MSRASTGRNGSLLILGLVLGAAPVIVRPQPVEGQFKKLKEKIKSEVSTSAPQTAEDLLKNAIRCAFDDATCIEQAKEQDKPVVLTDKEGNVLTTEDGEPVTDVSQLPPEGISQPAASAGPVTPLSLSLPDPEWLNDPAVKKYKHHFLIGRSVYNAETDEIVADSFVHSRIVAGHPELLTNPQLPAWGFAREPVIVPAGGRYVDRPNCTYTDCPLSEFRDRGASAGPMLSADYRRVIYFQDGDLWRAEVNWREGTIENRQQVTQVGALSNGRVNQWPQPLHWHGNVLLLKADHLSKEKPILRVDLSTGAIEEMPTLGIFEIGMFANLSGSRLCSRQSAVLKCYDVKSGTTTEIALPVGDNPHDPLFGGSSAWASGWTSPQKDTPEGTLWVNDDVAISYYNGIAPHPGFASDTPPRPPGLVRVDFGTGRAEILFQGEFVDGDKERPEVIRRIALLPGNRHVAVDLIGRHPAERKVRVSVEDGSTVGVEGVDPTRGDWLDSDRYLYAVSEGGLSDLGTWLYDVSSGTAVRVCQVPAPLHFGAQGELADVRAGIFFSELDSVFFVNPQGSQLYKVDLETQTCTKTVDFAPGTHVALSRFVTPPVDLRLDESGPALW